MGFIGLIEIPYRNHPRAMIKQILLLQVSAGIKPWRHAMTVPFMKRHSAYGRTLMANHFSNGDESLQTQPLDEVSVKQRRAGSSGSQTVRLM